MQIYKSNFLQVAEVSRATRCLLVARSSSIILIKVNMIIIHPKFQGNGDVLGVRAAPSAHPRSSPFPCFHPASSEAGSNIHPSENQSLCSPMQYLFHLLAQICGFFHGICNITLFITKLMTLIPR